jgi:hypothetical protein
MRRRYGLTTCIFGALALALAACGQASEAPGMDAATEAPAPSVSAAQNDTEYCGEVGRRVSVEDCQVFARLADDATAGAAAFNAPNPMKRGEVHTLQLAISFAETPEEIAARERAAAAEAERLEREANSEQEPAQEPSSAATEPLPPTPAETVDPLQGETVQFAPLVGRFMRAELVGSGFEITALSPASQEVLEDSVTTWNWRVKALEGGARSLTLRTVVEGCSAEGVCYPLRSTSHNYEVDVRVGFTGQVQDFLGTLPNWLKLISAVLVALAGLVAAVFGLRNAFRKGRGGG